MNVPFFIVGTFFIDNLLLSSYLGKLGISFKEADMKTFSSRGLLGLSLAISLPAFSAAPCVSLDYQEMKEMQPDDLIKEYCSAHTNVRFYSTGAKMDAILADVRRQTGARVGMRSDGDNAGNAEQCKSQRTRIGRVLSQRGVDEAALQLECEKPTQK